MNDNKNLTRDDIAESLHLEFGLTKKDCIIFVNDIIEIITDGLLKNGFVKIHNFGSFKIKRKKSRIGRNPKTKESKEISSRKVLLFKPSKEFKKLVNSKDNE